MKSYHYLFFDLDGTLTDSAPGILRSAAHALSAFGIQVEDLRELNPFVGPPLEDSFKDFYHFTDEQAEKAVKIYHERYHAIGVHENSPYPGVYECLEELKRRGFCLVVATSKPEKLARVVLHEFHLESYFDFVGGRDENGVLHTKADVIRYAVSALGIEDKENIVMIGDRKHDIIGAKEVGIDSIGVLFGYGDKEELEAAGATCIVEDYDRLLDLLGEHTAENEKKQ